MDLDTPNPAFRLYYFLRCRTLFLTSFLKCLHFSMKLWLRAAGSELRALGKTLGERDTDYSVATGCG